ncbi:protein-glutamate O-methyltransferase CheR [Qipengyuania pelagi]|jgi:chemotaxis protein methyltransferase CheR|uniref:Protein-glutamate O-methyltransferase CheR n=1 Tax=Qipengyuania pelagi TaxID=994320 RepID=A0A844Y9Z3_9SPHN|nr:protein-glutamate O-methyltransferase CheR [Qipengyuania pelagi]MXO54207.1 protein-glutamate O-methyltransferase CheR [Qipengyuania pelagi]
MAGVDASHRIVADLLRARTGQHLSEARMWRVPSALAGLFRARGISNVDQLVCLLAAPDARDLATEVVEALLNNETYFFRDTAFFDRLAETVLPDIFQRRKATRRIAIWSAGCSTGQEALSLAMLFADDPDRWRDWTIEIVGTDISHKAISVAQSGLYSQFEIQRGMDIHRMLRHFDEVATGWQAKPELRALTRFRQASLFSAPPATHGFDLVLCRNVMLYFDAPKRAEGFARLAQGMALDGWLMLGSGETVLGQTPLFETSDEGPALYRRAAAPVSRECARATKVG